MQPNTLPETETKPAPKRWTFEEEALLHTAFITGESIPNIAQMLGRTSGAILARLNQLDLISYAPYHDIAHLSHLPNSDETPKNSNEKWSKNEEEVLIKRHQTSPTTEGLLNLAEKLQRSPKSLVLKLASLGEITPSINKNPNPQEKRAPKKAELKTKPKTIQPLTKPSPPSKKLKVSITPEFQAARRTIEEGHNLLILGSAGTGKSTFLKWLRHQFDTKRIDKNYVVLAPTGMAALNVGGQTIHSFFGLKAELLHGITPWRTPKKAGMFKKLDLIIIDEISMVRADVMDAIDAFLRKYGPTQSEPFGGVQILALGDLFQLSPVVRGREERQFFQEYFGTPFFFGAHSWQNAHFHVLEFNEIFRQKDAHFIKLLHRIRHGEKAQDLLSTLNKRVSDDWPNGAVILAARNNTVDTINQTELEKLDTREYLYTAKTTGQVDEKAFTTPKTLVLKKGARVMFTKNDINGRWVNGSLGEVIQCDPQTVTVKLDTGDAYMVEPAKWELTKYDIDPETEEPVATIAGTFAQLPLTLAWALTIHKAQGQTLEQCVVDLSDGGAFADGQLYVALSRARNLEALFLKHPIKPSDIRTAQDVKSFYAALPFSS